MKSTKRILSAILSVVMILGCLTVGFTAQASAADLVDAIAKGGNVNWTGGDVTLTDTLVINSDVTVDFNGAVITGPVDKTAINIKSGNVTLYDGVIIADNKDWSGEKSFVKTLMNYKPAISINGGNVNLDCITAVGSVIRVPNSSSVEVPIGNGINANAGTVVLDNVIAFGMKALDNTKADVTVNDAILIGIYKAVNQYKDVDFGANNTQYETVDFLEGFLQDGVSLSANEKKYIAAATNSQGDFSVGSVIVNVATPNFNELTSTYNNGVLSVIAAEELHEEAEVANRYSYKYTPDVCTVDGQEAEFELVDSQYVATFTGLEENKEYTAEANYDLSVKLGKKQKEVVSGALKTLSSYADKAPELLYRFVKDFENLYEKAEGYVALAFNALASASQLGISADQYADLKPIKGLIYALEGREFNGSETVDGKEVILENGLVSYNGYGPRGAYNDYLEDKISLEELKATLKAQYAAFNASAASTFGPIFDTDGDDVADSVFAYTYGETFEITKEAYNDSELAIGTPGYGSGKGLLDVFDEYYDAIMAKLYGDSTTEFNDIGAAAEYIGDNWEGILELAENAVVLMDAAYALVNDADNDAMNALINKVLGSGSLDSYMDALDTAVKYVHKVMDRVDEVKESNFVATYGDKAGEYCKRYALKAWNIANNPDKYFEIEVDGDYVNVDLLADELNIEGTVNTNVEAKDVNVTVNVTGVGAAKLNDLAQATYYNEWFAYGDDITITPVETDANASLVYMVVTTNGNQTIVDGGVFTAKAATNLEIDIVFQADEQIVTSDAEIIVMTDKALNYKFIGKVQIAASDIASDWEYYIGGFEAPDFKGLTKLGWTLNKDGSNAKATLADVASDVAAAAETSEVVIVYAAYSYDEKVEVETQTEVIKMTEKSVADGKAYFTVSIQLGDAKAIEAGIIVTKNAALATEDTMNIKLSGTQGVAFSRTSKVDADGYVNPNVLYTAGVKTTGTVYARGYVVYADGTAEYTEIVSLYI